MVRPNIQSLFCIAAYSSDFVLHAVISMNIHCLMFSLFMLNWLITTSNLIKIKFANAGVPKLNSDSCPGNVK